MVAICFSHRFIPFFLQNSLYALHRFILFVRTAPLYCSFGACMTLCWPLCWEGAARPTHAWIERGTSKIRLVNEIIVANCSFGMVLFSSLTDFMRRTLVAWAPGCFKREKNETKKGTPTSLRCGSVAEKHSLSVTLFLVLLSANYSLLFSSQCFAPRCRWTTGARRGVRERHSVGFYVAQNSFMDLSEQRVDYDAGSTRSSFIIDAQRNKPTSH